LGVDFVVDSSKELCWLVDTQEWAVGQEIRVFKLLLWKDPIDLAYSNWKRHKGLTGWRHEFVAYYTKFFQTGLPFRSVLFGDLVSNPQRKLAEICSAVGMPYFEGKERFWDKQHHHLFGSHGTNEQVVAKASTIRVSETFDPDFEMHLGPLSQQITEDPTVQKILETLQQAEISSNGSFSTEDQRVLAQKPYPLWYYLRRARHRVRRHFPEKTTWVK